MNKKNLHSIFEKGSCLSIEQMQAYLSGKLSAKEVYLFEKHINACPECSDMFEGLQIMKNPSQIPVIISELNTNIDNYLILNVKHAGIRTNKFWKIAASFLLLVGSGILITYYTQNMSKDFAVQKTIVQEPSITESSAIENPPQVMEEKIIPKTDKQKESKAIAHKKEAENKLTKSESSKNEETGIVDNELEDMELAEESSEEIFIIPEKEEFDKESVIAEENPDSQNTDLYLSRAKIASSKSSKKKSISYLQLGINAYQEKNYSEALEYLKIAEKQDENSEKTAYYLAITYFTVNNYKKAEKYFIKLQSETTNVYYWDALWYQSQILIKRNKREKALQLLKQIAQSKSKYKQQAENKLDSLLNKLEIGN